MLILASQSASRKEMLTNAGVCFDARPAFLDERALEAGLGDASPEQIALALAEAKALAPELDMDEADFPVLGSDSLVVVDGQRYDKPASREEAAEHLRSFSGQEMELYSAAAIARNGAIIWRHSAMASLHVRDLSPEFIESYLQAEWPDVGYCAGVFRIEALGVQLFDKIQGDHFTILGMPLLPVLGALRDMRELDQ